ncbi:hypothetical protein [Spirillospora sp. NPDC029432]|uniref:hypothetical protein n=1 Tax=Spirillospora sp. NPDC029432 TaxID=3154599 RepID=UPI003453E55D
MTARTPEQDGAPPVAEDGDELTGPLASRRIRRRLTFGTPEALGEEPARPQGKRGKRPPSPWQRAQEAWEQAGVPWPPSTHGLQAPPRRKPVPASSERTAAAGRRGTGLRRPGHAAVAVAAGGVVAVAAGAYAVSANEGDAGDAAPRSAVAAAKPAEGVFTLDPAARTDGLVQNVAAVAAAGPTVVATGTETAGDGTPGRERAEFLVSQDGGRSWRLAPVRAPDGAEPAPGARPRMLAGGAGAWAAIGQTAVPGEAALWTSVDGREWTREPGTGLPFGPNDRVNALARTSGGFVAAGVTSRSGRFTGDTRGVVWTSAEGRVWRRGADLAPLGIAGLGGLAASGDTLVAHGTHARTVTKNVKRKGKKKGTRKVTTTVRGEGLWRSADGGRTWAPVNVPHAQGSYGPVRSLAAGPGGFYAVRDGKTTTGRKKKRKTARYGVVFGSRDGAAWAPAGRLSVPGYARVERLAGTPAGLAAIVRGGPAATVLHSADGRAWRPGATVRGAAVSGLAVAGGGVAVAGGQRGQDGLLAVAGPAAGPAAPVDLTRIPGAVRPERAVTAMAPGAPGTAMAVGSTGGSAAAWLRGGDGTWTRGPAPAPGARLTAVAHGPHGWLAVGRAAAPNGTPGPLVTASRDGRTWRRTGVPGGRAASGAASGPGGYVVVGQAGNAPAAWRSADLARWTRGASAGRGDLAGPAAMRDVASTGTAYVAVGGRQAARPAKGGPPPGELPAVWTSPDGQKWTAAAPPALPAGLASGAFGRVVARGNALVALGSGRTAAAPGAPRAFAAQSADGGRTWRPATLPGTNATTALTAATATAKGFLLAGAEGAAGRQDVALWASPDGAAWRRVAASGNGLDGPGDQRLTALAPIGNDVVGAGVSAGHRGETPTLWRTPAP